jgi:hypothetical protein
MSCSSRLVCDLSYVKVRAKRFLAMTFRDF